VLVSVCGGWVKGNFDTVLRIIEEFAKNVGCEFEGAILRPPAYLMRTKSEKTTKVLNALQQVGSELVTTSVMSTDLLEIISQPLISEEAYRQDLTMDCLKLKENTK